MTEAENKLSKGMLVELNPGAEQVYPRALAGMRGIVRDLREDDGFGFYQVYIEWDKQHWRYNGEQDGWTFATHFRPVGSNTEVDETEIPQEDLIISLKEPSHEDVEEMQRYINAVGIGFEKASESQGFFLITLKRTQSGALKLDLLGATTDEDLAALRSSQILRFAEKEMERIEEEEE